MVILIWFTDHAIDFTDHNIQPPYHPYTDRIPTTYSSTNRLYRPHADQINLVTITIMNLNLYHSFVSLFRLPLGKQ